MNMPIIQQTTDTKEFQSFQAITARRISMSEPR